MTDLSALNGYDEAPSSMQLVGGTEQTRAGRPAPLNGHQKIGRAATPPPTVSLIIPVRNEARNIAWVLEQVADEVDEIILVDGNSTDATLITACSYRPDLRVVAQEGDGKGSALRTRFLAATGDAVGANPIYTEAYGQFDATLGYNFDDHFSVTLDAINIGDGVIRQHERTTDALASITQTGRIFMLGARYKF